jgi:hypothetical protein
MKDRQEFPRKKLFADGFFRLNTEKGLLDIPPESRISRENKDARHDFIITDFMTKKRLKD